ncbi:hypothetical protein EVA_09863 [gut metagenome]|uniref:Uncharacterized protein n=1 Tax=gut metagenome TaxID=749906 RepID=J9G5B0_9ZZZZ
MISQFCRQYKSTCLFASDRTDVSPFTGEACQSRSYCETSRRSLTCRVKMKLTFH